ncbi:MAG TPA: helix-turn-helix domain-containing protein, partial [Stackebrandtia sp.]|uniref:TetR/AcrR family transcriptional regulator n=1 Tax=Stackebrandtia sp. TaxID=2023065 RepID=UPI002D6640D6
MTGLRERKKERTRLEIQRHALRLFRQRGYANTTMEQVAEAAEVSPSTLFRYFPTKEDLIGSDDFGQRLAEAYDAQPAALGAVEALRAA